jgi:hypothetical protein
MDFYLNEQNTINRLVSEWIKYGKIIIAYDFDDTVYDFHNKGRKYDDVINLLKQCKSLGAYFIVFTSCNENDYDKIRNYLAENEIPFDKINENLNFVKFTGRKVYYNILLDDRAGLSSSYKCLLQTIKIIENV